MIGTEKRNFKLFIPSIYFVVFFLLATQFLLGHSYKTYGDAEYQNHLQDTQQGIFEDPLLNHKISPEYFSSNQEILSQWEPSAQRRFCCMSPVSGRKRSLRNLARQQKLSNLALI